MTTVTVSPKFQIVIPKRVREALGLRPGQKMQVIQYQNRVVLVPVLPVAEARGFLPGLDTAVPREEDRV